MQTHRSTLISLLVDKALVELQLSFTLTSAQKRLKTLEHSVPERKEWVEVESHFTIRDHHSTELFQISWPKEVISLLEMVQEVNQFMVINSMMKTSPLDILEEEIFQWQMLAQTQMVPNSS